MCHQERRNSISTATFSLKVGDIVTVHIQVQSKSESGTVKNLSYQVKFPFVFTKDLHHNAFEVK